MTEETGLQVRNSAYKNSPGRWNWAVWIEGTKGKLDEIDYVEYTLHPTFPQPVRIVSERSNKFRLDCRGWGEFTIHAKITKKDGQVLRLDHWLILRDTTRSDSAQVSIKGATSESEGYSPFKTTVFVSYSKADFPVFKVLRKLLEDHGLEVVTADTVRPGQPWEREIKSLIGRAHAVVALLSEEPSRWVVSEIAEAQRQNVSVVPVLLGNVGLPTNIADLEPVRVENPNDTRGLVAVAEEHLARVGL
jgi:hypothetical protein